MSITQSVYYHHYDINSADQGQPFYKIHEPVLLFDQEWEWVVTRLLAWWPRTYSFGICHIFLHISLPPPSFPSSTILHSFSYKFVKIQNDLLRLSHEKCVTRWESKKMTSIELLSLYTVIFPHSIGTSHVFQRSPSVSL